MMKMTMFLDEALLARVMELTGLKNQDRGGGIFSPGSGKKGKARPPNREGEACRDRVEGERGSRLRSDGVESRGEAPAIQR